MVFMFDGGLDMVQIGCHSDLFSAKYYDNDSIQRIPGSCGASKSPTAMERKPLESRTIAYKRTQ